MTTLLPPVAETPARRRARGWTPWLLAGACLAGAGGCSTATTGHADPYVATKTKAADGGVVRAGAEEPAPPADKSGGDWFSKWNPFAPPEAPPPPADGLIIRGDAVSAVKTPPKGGVEERLAGGRELFRREEYSKAEAVFRSVGEDSKASPTQAQEGLYYEAESLRLQGYYPKAADVYNDLLNKFPSSAYRPQAVQHMFDIANYWLDETRAEMDEWKEYNEKKRWFFCPHFFCWFDRTKPFLDVQGRAVEKLEEVRNNDIDGPLADQALFLAGSYYYYNEDFKRADEFFSQIYEHHPNSPLAARAVDLAIVAKNRSTGGPSYDGRKAAEARRMVDAALRGYPELAQGDKGKELMNKLAGITLQQAAKDYDMAEFWKRTGHPGSAYFQYAVVQQRYPNTKYADLAAQRMDELRGELEKKGEPAPQLPPPGGRPAPGAADAPARPGTPAPGPLPSGLKP
jgi:outer membrane protein assembly factor BamD (BamD/ComL family)